MYNSCFLFFFVLSEIMTTLNTHTPHQVVAVTRQFVVCQPPIKRRRRRMSSSSRRRNVVIYLFVARHWTFPFRCFIEITSSTRAVMTTDDAAQFYLCNCFTTDNFFLEDFSLHVRFVSEQQFRLDYEAVSDHQPHIHNSISVWSDVTWRDVTWLTSGFIIDPQLLRRLGCVTDQQFEDVLNKVSVCVCVCVCVSQYDSIRDTLLTITIISRYSDICKTCVSKLGTTSDGKQKQVLFLNTNFEYFPFNTSFLLH